MDHRVKAKQPTNAQHLWEVLPDCWRIIPGDELMTLTERIKSAKLSPKQKEVTLKNLKYKTHFTLFTPFLCHIILLIIHSFDVFGVKNPLDEKVCSNI